MNKKNKFKLSNIVLLIVLVLCLSIISVNNKKTVETSTNTINKIGWGIKRNDNHEQPDVGTENKKILELNNGICLGNKEKKYIYLTFDLGYEAGYTSKILDVLKDNDVKATFFITGHYLNTASDLVQRMIDEGHIVGNHTINHKSMPDLSDEELKREIMGLHQYLYEKFDCEMNILRPPKGEFNERTLRITKELGYKTVMWSFAYEDWDEKNQPDLEKAKEKIVSNIHNGEIMLLHATSKTNSEILEDVIKKAREIGYEFKNLDSFE